MPIKKTIINWLILLWKTQICWVGLILSPTHRFKYQIKKKSASSIMRLLSLKTECQTIIEKRFISIYNYKLNTQWKGLLAYGF